MPEAAAQMIDTNQQVLWKVQVTVVSNGADRQFKPTSWGTLVDGSAQNPPS